MGHSEYTKMCEKAEEIQAIKPWFISKPITWCPSQDRLQDMLPKDYGLCEWVSEFADFAGWLYAPLSVNCSQEQLWLAFVMKQKYGKTWTGEEWEEASVATE